MKVYCVLIDGKLEPEEGAKEVRVFSKEKYANEHKRLLESYDFMKGKDIKVVYQEISL